MMDMSSFHKELKKVKNEVDVLNIYDENNSHYTVNKKKKNKKNISKLLSCQSNNEKTLLSLLLSSVYKKIRFQ